MTETVDTTAILNYDAGWRLPRNFFYLDQNQVFFARLKEKAEVTCNEELANRVRFLYKRNEVLKQKIKYVIAFKENLKKILESVLEDRKYVYELEARINAAEEDIKWLTTKNDEVGNQFDIKVFQLQLKRKENQRQQFIEDLKISKYNFVQKETEYLKTQQQFEEAWKTCSQETDEITVRIFELWEYYGCDTEEYRESASELNVRSKNYLQKDQVDPSLFEVEDQEVLDLVKALFEELNRISTFSVIGVLSDLKEKEEQDVFIDSESVDSKNNSVELVVDELKELQNHQLSVEDPLIDKEMVKSLPISSEKEEIKDKVEHSTQIPLAPVPSIPSIPDEAILIQAINELTSIAPSISAIVPEEIEKKRTIQVNKVAFNEGNDKTFENIKEDQANIWKNIMTEYDSFLESNHLLSKNKKIKNESKQSKEKEKEGTARGNHIKSRKGLFGRYSRK